MQLIQRLIFRLIVVLIIPAICLSGCSSDDEKQIEKNNAFLDKTINQDWSDGIPLDNLVTASKICSAGNYQDKCAIVAADLIDISISYSSCLNDISSKLCQFIVVWVGQHEISKILPTEKSIPLPKNPWYKNMPTVMLDSLSWTYGYRTEATEWWLATWVFQIEIALACIALLLVSYLIWVWWDDNNTRKENEARVAKKRQAQKRDNALKAQAEKKRLQSEILEKLDHPTNDTPQFTEEKLTAIDEQAEAQSKQESEQQAQQMAELQKKQQADAAAIAKLKKEQAEAKVILEIAFPRKNLPKPSKQISGSVLE